MNFLLCLNYFYEKIAKKFIKNVNVSKYKIIEPKNMQRIVNRAGKIHLSHGFSYSLAKIHDCFKRCSNSESFL